MADPVNQRTFSRILPESTGDRIGFLHTWDIEYKDKTGSFPVDSIVVDSITGLQGRVLEDTVDNNILTSGVVSVTLLTGHESAISSVGAALSINAVSQATVITGYCVYIGKNVLTGYNNPHYGQYIDNEGQAYIRFAEGSIGFDATGLARVTTPTQLGEYFHEYDLQPEQWHNNIIGGGSVIHLPNEASVKLSVGTASGDKIVRTTHKYHRYQTSGSQLCTISIVCGDNGKTDLIRQWGYYDDDNGIYFEHSGTNEISVVLRSKITGSVVNTIINQSSWNGDPLDGTGLSGINLDLTKANLYWIDLQLLAGPVRFGVFSPNGQRVVGHTIESANSNISAYMTTANLPVRYMQENTGITGSTSEMKFLGASVFTELPLSAEHNKWHWMHNIDVPQLATSTTAVPLFSIRSTALVNGITNRIGSIPEVLALFIGTQPIKLKILKNAVLTGATWSQTHGACDIDIGATAVSGTDVMASFYFDVGIVNEDIDEHFNYLGEYIRRHADGSEGEIFTFTVETFTGAGTIETSFTWFDHIQTP